jgi:transposase-like protein
MEEVNEVQGKRKRTHPPRGWRDGPFVRTHMPPFEVRRKALQLHLEEGFPVRQVAFETGVGSSTLSNWARVYRVQGDAASQPRPRRRGALR